MMYNTFDTTRLSLKEEEDESHGTSVCPIHKKMASFIVLNAFRRKKQGTSSTMLSLYSSTIKASIPPLRSPPPSLSVGSLIRFEKRDHSTVAACGGVSMSSNKDSHGSSSQVRSNLVLLSLFDVSHIYLFI